MNALGHAQNQLKWCTENRPVSSNRPSIDVWERELEEAKVAAIIAVAEALQGRNIHVKVQASEWTMNEENWPTTEEEEATS